MSWKRILLEGDAAVLSDTPPVDVKNQTAAAGTATEASKQDHAHDLDLSASALSELGVPTGAVSMNSQRLTGLGAVTTQGDAIPADANLRAADSSKLEGSTKTEVQTHAPAAHTLASHSTKAHTELTDVTTDQHHAQAHALNAHSVATGAVDFGKQEATTLVLHTSTGAPSTPVDGQIYFEDGDDHPYVYIAA